MSGTIAIRLTVNGISRQADVAPQRTLLDLLRDDLGLTGTKECCLVGECPARKTHASRGSAAPAP